MIFKRNIADELQKYLNSREIIVLTGMRQTGKTTLYKSIFNQLESKNKLFLDIENPLEQKIFEEIDYNNIVLNFKKLGIDPDKKIYIFLDEIQAMPEIVKPIKYLYDHYNIKFFVTGSSSYYFKNLFPESLAGRKFVFELFPLDFQEFLAFNNIKVKVNFKNSFSRKESDKNEIVYEKIKKYYDEYLKYGGFPAVVLANSIQEKEIKLKDIFKSYFEKDVKVLADFKDINVLRDLILLIMQRVGSKIEITKLSKELEVSRETIYSYLSFLENTYFIHFITPYTKNVDREVSGSKKVYLCDNGLLNYFSRVAEGSLYENSVYLNLRKYGGINYYQKRTGNEIDFIIDKKTALEAKNKGLTSDYNKLKRLAQILEIKDYYVITKIFNKDKGFIPAQDI